MGITVGITVGITTDVRKSDQISVAGPNIRGPALYLRCGGTLDFFENLLNVLIV